MSEFVPSLGLCRTFFISLGFAGLLFIKLGMVSKQVSVSDFLFLSPRCGGSIQNMTLFM